MSFLSFLLVSFYLAVAPAVAKAQPEVAQPIQTAPIIVVLQVSGERTRPVPKQTGGSAPVESAIAATHTFLEIQKLALKPMDIAWPAMKVEPIAIGISTIPVIPQRMFAFTITDFFNGFSSNNGILILWFAGFLA